MKLKTRGIMKDYGNKKKMLFKIIIIRYAVNISNKNWYRNILICKKHCLIINSIIFLLCTFDVQYSIYSILFWNFSTKENTKEIF